MEWAPSVASNPGSDAAFLQTPKSYHGGVFFDHAVEGVAAGSANLVQCLAVIVKMISSRATTARFCYSQDIIGCVASAYVLKQLLKDEFLPHPSMSSLRGNEPFMSAKHPECPLYNPLNCKEYYNPKLCAFVRKDRVCLKKKKPKVRQKPGPNA